jgi:large repetitive protein
MRVENPDGNAVISTSNILTVSDAPTWSTAAGTLGTFAGDFSGTLATLSATSDSAITYSETTSALSGAGVTLNTSTGALTTTDFGGSSTTATTYNFTIRATDAENQTADRSFSLTSSYGATGGGQFN